MKAWSRDEAFLLLKILDERNILDKISGRGKRNKEIFLQVLEEFVKKGVKQYTWQQIRVKWKNIKAQYFKLKADAEKRGQEDVHWFLYKPLQILLGDRPRDQAVREGDVDTLSDFFRLGMEKGDTGCEENAGDDNHIYSNALGTENSSSEDCSSDGNISTYSHRCCACTKRGMGFDAGCETGGEIFNPMASGRKKLKLCKRQGKQDDIDKLIQVIREEAEKDRQNSKELVAEVTEVLKTFITQMVGMQQTTPPVVYEMEEYLPE